jgi:LPXTG-site transpeptidase (sortase) family protein
MQFRPLFRSQLGEVAKLRPSSAQLRRFLPVFLMVIGGAILIYVVSQYWTMYSEQRRLAREWDRQQAQTNVHRTKIIDDGLTRISVPAINLDAVIVEGTSHKALLRGPGHLKGTPSPGDLGNSVISGHRDTFFRHIYELNKGDIVTVQRDGKAFNYQVTGKEIVQPTDLSVLAPSPDARLTLITCYPTYYIGPAPKRLVVFTKLVDDKQASIEATSAIPGKAAAAVAH